MSFDTIDNPTWEYPIGGFFNPIDINHMLQVTHGELNLGKYEDVKKDGKEIYVKLLGEDFEGVTFRGKRMPLPPSPYWTQEMLDLYKKWMDNDYPEA
ncbi:MAG: hypothetical protein QNJ36_04465 [Calothrix sp. MO_167.B42]|nr:hypothetical protein [Calothrix sp. MO_167.B42]